MASITKDGVTLNYPDTIEAGHTYVLTYSVEANTGRAKTVEFVLETTHGAQEKLTIQVAGS